MLDRDYKKDCEDLEAFVQLQNQEIRVQIAKRKTGVLFGVIVGIASSSVVWGVITLIF
jgi:tetrahydromethanopterin S-methyltransferase subunit G